MKKTYRCSKIAWALLLCNCALFTPGTSRAVARPFVHFAPAPFFTPHNAPAGARNDRLWRDADPELCKPLAIEAGFLKEKLSELTGEVPVRVRGESFRIKERYTERGLARARVWLRQEYEAMGFVVSAHEGFGGVNFIAEKPGSEGRRVLIVSSHLDAVEGVPGADDDGSGTVTALAIARALSMRSFKHTLRVVAFDQEEGGLIGSQAYVEHLEETGRLKHVLGDIQLEMTGYNPGGRNNVHIIDCDDEASAVLSRKVARAIHRQHIPLNHVRACTDASDHASFWSVDKPGIVVSENFFGGDGNPCYHDTCDTVDQLDFDYMANIGRAVGSAVASLLEPVGK